MNKMQIKTIGEPDKPCHEAYLVRIPESNQFILYIGREVFRDQQRLDTILLDMFKEMESHGVDPLELIKRH